MRALNVVLPSAILIGLLAVNVPAHDKPFVGKLETETRPDAKQAVSRPTPSQEVQASFTLDSVKLAVDSDVDDFLALPIADVRIDGNLSRTKEETLKLVKMRPGMVFDAKQVVEDILALSTRKWFSKIEPVVEKSEKGPVLIYRVQERPRLEKVTFIGNRELTDEYLAAWCEIVELKPGGVSLVEDRESARSQLLSLYHLKGHAFAEVILQKGASPDDREVEFRINEGPRVVVAKVGFTGNATLPEWILKLHGRTATHSFWLSSCLYRASDVSADVDALKQLYESRGYFDARIESRQSFSKNRSEVHIDFVIEEGIRYKIRDIEFEGNEGVAASSLRYGMESLTNEYYDQRLVRIDGEKIEDQYRQLGIVDPHAEPRVRPISESRDFVDLIYSIEDRAHEKANWIYGPHQSDIRQDARQRAASLDVQNQELHSLLAQQQRQSAELQAELHQLQRKPGNPQNQTEGIQNGKAAMRSSLPARAVSTENPPPPRKSAEPAVLRDLNQLTFSGVETFDEVDIRRTLAIDFDWVVAAHPDYNVFNYLKVLEGVMVSGYEHGGFPDATVEVRYNSTRGRVEVHVQEGHRYRCGEVQISGAGKLSADRLTRALTKHAKSSRICWKIGEPVPFDAPTMSEMRAQLKAAFSDAGYFDPEFDLLIERDPDERTALLLVTISDEGPCAVVRRIEVAGTNRDSADDVRKFLDVAVGTTCDRDLLDGLKRRLLDSGRYLHVNVKTESAPRPVVDGCKPHDVRIQLREYAEAAPIAQELPPGEQVLLKLQDWAERWARGETGDDVVMTGLAVADGVPLPMNNPSAVGQQIAGAALQLNIRMIVRPGFGQTIWWGVTRGDGRKILDSVFAAGPREIVFASPLRKAKLVLPLSTEEKVTCYMLGEELPVERITDDGCRFRLNIGLKWNTRSGGYPNPFEVDPHFTAAFLTSLARFDKPQCTIQDGTCEIRSESLTLRIDQATGRLIECRVPMGDGSASLSIRTERNAFEAERQNIDGVLTTCDSTYAPESPWKSIVEFLMDEYLEAGSQVGMSDRMSPCRALRKVIGAWDAPGIGELYRAIDLSTKAAHPFVIPSHLGGLASGDSTERGSFWRKRTAASVLLPIYSHLVPNRGWMWSSGRDAVLSWASDAPVPIASLCAAPLSEKTGPLGELFLGLMDKYGDLDLVRKIASQEGLQRLTAEALSNDYWPLLSDESWLGRWILSLAKAVRALDESEIQSLVSLLPDDELLPREALATSLVLLNADRAKPVGELLPGVIDRFWEEGLRNTVRTALTKLVPARLYRFVPKPQESSVVPAGAEEDAAVAADEDDDILVPVVKERRPREPRRLKSEAPPDQGFFPDGEPIDETPELLP